MASAKGGLATLDGESVIEIVFGLVPGGTWNGYILLIRYGATVFVWRARHEALNARDPKRLAAQWIVLAWSRVVRSRDFVSHPCDPSLLAYLGELGFPNTFFQGRVVFSWAR